MTKLPPYAIPPDAQAAADGLTTEQREWLDTTIRAAVDAAARRKPRQPRRLVQRQPRAAAGWMGRDLTARRSS